MTLNRTAIEWADYVWNPVTGCTKVSPGCDHCYAERVTNRWLPGGFDTVRLHPERLDRPFGTKPGRVFVNSMSDLFHDDVPAEFVAKVFGVMAATPHLTYLILTKRHGRMRSLLNADHFRDDAHSRLIDIEQRQPVEHPFSWPLPNVWLGVSVENQQWADIRIPALIDTPAAIRFLSCEPLIGPVSLRATSNAWGAYYIDGIDWVIAGGESGADARPMDPQWARQLRDECNDHDVPFFFKQWGGHTPKAGGKELDGREWCEFPTALVGAA